ncbi:class I SAM-dependent methyltransferase [Tsuneonella troitsensis]|uniref:class I SAM-dependent methyltransferase n=1 Tax=Tsuneonella troitsensis TaxID=292222 RepID=UPI0007104F27|nr:class I SAM-dependent methyltransferase [Tsuneonella troitsensis]
MAEASFEEQRENKERFQFGQNWKSFLNVLNETRINEAERSLVEMLSFDELSGMRFIDIGSGSGLSSLVARRLGAHVTSLDFDPASVWCTSHLRDRFFPGDGDWEVMEGSALDRPMLMDLGQFDIVYSWGVLHHTGEMWTGLRNAIDMIRPGGVLFIAIYNDQGWKSRAWWLIKRFYNFLPKPLHTIFAWSLGLILNAGNVLKYTVMLRPMDAIRPLLNYEKRRGMNFSHDLIDWMGGFPFQFATYEALVNYAEAAGLRHERGIKATSLGCHQIVFSKPDRGASIP